MTWLSRLHPYPAMLADPLIEELASKHVSRNTRVLDPFCGTGRSLFAAAQRGAIAVGTDVNPLAVLIARAKAHVPTVARLRQLHAATEALLSTGVSGAERSVVWPGRRVQWFSPAAERGLASIANWINAACRDGGERLFLAAILSATAREVSWARQDQWKLHRLTSDLRAAARPNPVRAFRRRLAAIIPLAGRPRPTGSVAVHQADARNLPRGLPRADSDRGFDLVLCSPPYGDSRTTVSYGGISHLCLQAIHGVTGVCDSVAIPSCIDAECLGGRTRESSTSQVSIPRTIWAGGLQNHARTRVAVFLSEMRAVCEASRTLLRKSGRMIWVIGRRSVGGHRLRLDEWFLDTCVGMGFETVSVTRRTIAGKLTPTAVDRFARGSVEQVRLTTTMREEFVLDVKLRAGRSGARIGRRGRRSRLVGARTRVTKSTGQATRCPRRD